MRKYIYILCLLMMGIRETKAQNSLTLSLKQAQTLGIERRFDLKAKLQETEILQQEIIQKQQNLLPDVKATANIMYHPQVQSTLIPAGFGGLSEPAVLALGAKSISVFSLEVKHTLYNPSLKTEIKIAETIKLKEEEAHREEILHVKKQITEAYLNVLLRKLQQQIAVFQEQRLQEYVDLMEGKYTNGVVVENDYLRVKLDYKNIQEQRFISQHAYELGLANLCYQMNIPASTKIILSDSLAVPSKEIIASKDSAILDNLSKFRQLSLEKQGLLLQEKKQQQSVLPVVNLIGNYSQQYLNMAFNYNYTDGKWWSPYSYVGLQIALPITKQFTNTSSIKKLSLRNSQLSFRIQQEKANVSFEINKSLTTLNNAYQRLQRTQENYGFAQKVYDNQKQQLQLGNLSYDTLLNTELSMSTAERNYISAVHEYLIAQLIFNAITEQL